jgi:hypothetical protein
MAMFEPRPLGHRDPRIGLLVGAAIVAIGWSAWVASSAAPGTMDDDRAALDAPIRVVLSAALVNPRFVATRALTDYGLEIGARYVAVRILSRVQLEVRVLADADVVLAGYPRTCLIGPFSMPDYAGLSDGCWGQPDISRLLWDRLPTDSNGRPVLRGGRAVTLTAALERDAGSCDYPPGDWRLEVQIDPFVEGAASRPLAIAPTPLDVPASSPGPLELVKLTNYCGIANVVYHEQGEPELVADAGGGR